MTTLRTAAQQALDTLLKSHTCPLMPDDCEAAIAALRAALAEPVQEPLGWAVQVGTHGAGRRRDKPRYTIFCDKAAAENLAYRTGAHPKPFYIGGNDE